MNTKSTLSLYWKCQLWGWSLAAFYWTLASLDSPEFIWYLAVFYFVSDLLLYIPLTHLYRNISRKYNWHKLQPRQLLIRIIPSVLVLGMIYLFLTWTKNFLLRVWFEPGFEGALWSGFENHWLNIFMAGVRLMAIWVLAYYGYHYAQREINAVRESSRLAVVAKEAEFNNLAAQLNPHFFFNSLNGIKALLVENPRAARRAIDLLSDLMRTSLYRREGRFITIREEMALVEDYLELEKIRFEKRLDTRVRTEGDPEEEKVLPLSIQTLVENAIKHGIARHKEGGTIAISILKKDNVLEVEVENPGSLQQEQGAGLGLRNLNERLKLQFQDKASLQIGETGRGTVLATLTIRLT